MTFLILSNLAQIANSDLTQAFDWQRPLVISVSSLIVLFIASNKTIRYPHVGPKMPLGPLAPIFNNISVAGFLGSVSLGHIIGAFLIINFLQT